MGLEIKFDDHQVRKNPFLGYKKLILSSGFFFMILVKNWKSLLGLVLDKIGHEIMFDDYLIRKQALLDYRKSNFYKVTILDLFQRG